MLLLLSLELLNRFSRWSRDHHEIPSAMTLATLFIPLLVSLVVVVMLTRANLVNRRVLTALRRHIQAGLFGKVEWTSTVGCIFLPAHMLLHRILRLEQVLLLFA